MWIVRLALLPIAIMLTASVSAMFTIRVLYSSGSVVPQHIVVKPWLFWVFVGIASVAWALAHATHTLKEPKK